MKLKGFLFILAQLILFVSLNTEGELTRLNAEQEKITRCQKWKKVALDEKNWSRVYDGYGKIAFEKKITLQPRTVASETNQTHAALVLLQEKQQTKDFAVRLSYQNTKTLRSPASNPWEVLWVMFNYTGDPQNKKTNYLILKPNGIELGKAWGLVDQEFLYTKDNPKIEIGKTYQLELIKKNNRVQAFVDDQLALDYTETDPKKKLFTGPGQIGLYTEDALVSISSFEICQE